MTLHKIYVARSYIYSALYMYDIARHLGCNAIHILRTLHAWHCMTLRLQYHTYIAHSIYMTLHEIYVAKSNIYSALYMYDIARYLGCNVIHILRTLHAWHCMTLRLQCHTYIPHSICMTSHDIYVAMKMMLSAVCLTSFLICQIEVELWPDRGVSLNVNEIGRRVHDPGGRMSCTVGETWGISEAPHRNSTKNNKYLIVQKTLIICHIDCTNFFVTMIDICTIYVQIYKKH